MWRDKRLWLLGLLALAAVLRLWFVLHLPALPLYWDEVHYNVWASWYARAWKEIGTPAVFLHDLTTAFQGSIAKGETYSAFVGFVYAVAGPHLQPVYVAQAILDVFTCLFVYGIARRLGGELVGLIALALAALYPPFIFATGRLQSETFCAFLYVGALRALYAGARRWPVAGVLGGLLLALAMLARPALQFLFPLLLVPIVLLHAPATWRRGLSLAAAFGAGFFLVIGPRLVITDVLFGRPLWSGITDPSMNAYAGIVPENLGWRTDRNSWAIPPRGALAAVMQERHDSQPTPEDYRLAVLRAWEMQPLASIAVLLHKTYIVWAHPYNDSRRTLVLGLRGQRRWHQLLLLLAALGLPLALRRWRVGLPLVLTVLYVWATYLNVQIEVRYVEIGMPLMLCFSALAAALLGRGLLTRWQDGRRRGIAVFAALALGGALLARGATVPRLLALSSGLSPGAAQTLHQGLLLTALLLGAALAYLLLRAVVGRLWALAATVAPWVAGACIFLVGGGSAVIWHQWSCPLTAGHGTVRQDFVLPPLAPPRRAELRLDLSATGGPADLVVLVNGQEVRRFAGGPRRADAVPTESYYGQVFAGQGRGQQPWHGWYSVPVPLSALTSRRPLAVELRVEATPGSSRPESRGDVVSVFGDYIESGERIYDGPSLLAPGKLADTSLYKYLGDGDCRMRRLLPLSPGSHSSYAAGGPLSARDLSPSAGIQTGRYRIFLLVFYDNGRGLVF